MTEKHEFTLPSGGKVVFESTSLLAMTARERHVVTNAYTALAALNGGQDNRGPSAEARIEKLPFTSTTYARIRKALAKKGIETVGQLRELSDRELCALPGVGASSFIAIRKALHDETRAESLRRLEAARSRR